MKQKLPLEIKNVFYDFLLDRIAVSDFKTWVYETDILETVLKPYDYLDLISLDFNQKWKDDIDGIKIAIFKLVKKYIGIEQYAIDTANHITKKIENLLLDLLNRKGDLVAKLVTLYSLYCQGCRFLPQYLVTEGAEFNSYLYELERPSGYVFPKSWTKAQIKAEIEKEIQRELPKLDSVISETLSLLQNGKIEIRIEFIDGLDLPYYDFNDPFQVQYIHQIIEKRSLFK